MAAIQALINEKTGERWGNPNVTYYALANAEYGASGSSACNSETVNPTSNTCAFYDITLGDNDSACEASGANLRNCYRPSGTVGVLSTSNSADQPAYTTNVGWDFPTGIGSVNVWNLIQAWPGSPD
jgi:subtilase family serine protease